MINAETKVKGNLKRRNFWADLVFRLWKEKPLGTIGAFMVVIILFIGIFANYIAPYGMNEPNLSAVLHSPSSQYIFGTDNLGRDVLSRIIYGARVSTIVGLTGALLSVFVSIIVGATSGFFGGKFDILLQRIVDAIMCFPSLILMMSVMSIVGAGLVQVIFVLGVTRGIAGSRVVRGAVIGIKENVYVTAGWAIGASRTRILVQHILPNVMAPIIILFTVSVGFMILSEATLSFLGFGIPPPTPSWGGMLSGTGRMYMTQAPWLAIWPGVALVVTVYGANMFGDSMRDLLDPRLRGGVGRYGGTKSQIMLKKRLGM